MGLRSIAVFGWVTFFAVQPAFAINYVKISEIMTGLPAAPTAQYIVLRFKAPGGSIKGYTLEHFAADGTSIGTQPFDTDVASAQTGAPILVANLAAQEFFNITADFTLVPQPLPNSGGSACLFDSNNVVNDCVIWGDAAWPSNNVATPSTINPFNAGGGIPLGYVARRILDSATLTTNNSRVDFILGVAPWVENSIGAVGPLPASVCGNGNVEGFEQCDDGAQNGTSQDSCTSHCLWIPSAACGQNCGSPNTTHAVCGNGMLETGEECDDNNTVNLDGCSNTCQWEPLGIVYNSSVALPVPVCGNHILENGEACDPPGSNCNDPNVTQNGNQPCTLLGPPQCGNGSVESGEQCDPNDLTAPMACAVNCTWPANHPLATCGNGLVETGENCDDGNGVDNDGCPNNCQLPVGTSPSNFNCGNGVWDPGESCDDGSNNGVQGHPCQSDCTWVNPPQHQAPTTTTGTTGGSSTTTGGNNATTGGNNATTGTSTTGGTSTVGASTTGGTSTAGASTTGANTTTGGTSATTGASSTTGTSATTGASATTGGATATTGGTTTAGATTGAATTGASTTTGSNTSGAPAAISCSNLGTDGSVVVGMLMMALARARRRLALPR